MSDYQVNVVKIDKVEKHPDADRLDVVTIGGYLCIANKNDDGSSRYKEGELVVYIPEGSVMPLWMMKEMDFWDINKDKPAFRYVKAKKLRGIFSQGILYPTDNSCVVIKYPNRYEGIVVKEGDDVAEFLGITKYEPPVPISMQGQASGEFAKYTMKVDFESIQKNMRLFDPEDEVIVTEKLHGTQCIIGYIPGLNHPDLLNGNILVTSKGVGAQGFVYKNLDVNKDNLYVKMLNETITDSMLEVLENVVKNGGVEITSIHIFGEIFGIGVQDLGYGFNKPQLRIFDIAINREFMPYDLMVEFVYDLGLDPVPILYRGKFDLEEFLPLRDGPTTQWARKDSLIAEDRDKAHIREGIVIKAVDGSYHPRYGRKIAKWVSPSYLLRKGNTTEFA